jgi:hypothetical protein
VSAGQTTAQSLLEAALRQSGLSLRKFANQKLARDERTARRWRSGDMPIPGIVQRWLREYLAGRSDALVDVE